MKSPLVSIIVPVYNTEQYLCKCLDSLINQSYQNLEIICVNDGSPDNSLSLLNNYVIRDSRIKIYSKPNGGLSDARNFGMRYISGEYFMFIDSDDWIDEKTIEECVDAILKEDAECLMFSYTKEFLDNSVPISVFSEKCFRWNRDFIRQNLLRRTFGPIGSELKRPQNCDITVSAWMQLFRSDKFKNITFYDNRELGTFEDGVYQIDVYSHCNLFCYIDKPYYHYRKTNTGSITTKYNPQLPEKWKKLFTVLEQKAEKYATDKDELATFKEAIENRIAVAILPLGLNEIRAPKNIFQKAASLAKIVNDPIYNRPLGKLTISQMPLSWKLFFFLAKKNMFRTLTAMLSAIEYARSHYQK